MATDRTAYLVLASLTALGNAELGRLIRTTGPALALDRVLHGRDISPQLAHAVDGRLGPAGRGPADVNRLADALVRRAEQLGARIITPADDEWPAPLHDLADLSDNDDPLYRNVDPPLCLWLRGPLHLADTLTTSVSIVGARAMTAYGQTITAEFAHDLASRHWTVVSGGAFGIDVTAHRGALNAAGPTVAVLACGIDRLYPAANAPVLEQIATTGLLLTESPPGTPPTRTAFLHRNRIIAATTRGTVIVEAGVRSGARNALGYARQLGRSVMAVPGPITSATSAGCHIELRRPDTILVTTVADIIAGLHRPDAPATSQTP